MNKIKKGDVVVIISGSDKGAVGKVVKVMPKEDKVLVSNVNIKTCFIKPSGMTPGSIQKKEAPISVSKVALLDPEVAKTNPTKLDSLKGNIIKIGFQIDSNGVKVRINKKSKLAI